MELNRKIIQKLNLPNVSQIGVVTRDLDQVMAHYEKELGLGPFVELKITYTNQYYHGKPTDSLWRLGFCSLGPVELELIEPVTGPTVYHDFLKEKGEGLHHIGFDVKDMDEKIRLCAEAGELPLIYVPPFMRVSTL